MDVVVEGFVVRVDDVGPRMRRVVLDVPKLADLNLPGVGDEAVGLYFPSEPDGRNYTIRHRTERQLTCDFVLHERGVATGWAQRARTGDRVVLDHARSWYRPESTTVWQLLIADLAGLPALARILEDGTKGVDTSVIVEVADESDLDYLAVPPGVSSTSTIGSGNGTAASRLPELARAHSHPDGRGYCWFAGEASATREVRKHLRADHGWTANQYDVVGYWRFDSETWDRRFEAVSDEMVAVYEKALAEGKGDKIASEEFDLALERVGL
ncbi:siderophore-interacting protein [Mycobacterium yunnanensis]|uniref:Siderophore-interacting protein n=1 Tax=Mycobacterium yunnanensis TaxID=368477 RepID=A0A9X3BS22_9MYCO|nr:siderophore-interacting protein [Mycobacterium yunnanensis]MCV7419600.1 siderophore-interacting protein [Mycobacterium yunnanensis]